MKWATTRLSTVKEASNILMLLKAKGWLCRGQSRHWRLKPSIERCHKISSPAAKRKIERRSIEIFRSSARNLCSGEEAAIRDDFIALMVLRHYGFPTRLLDWTGSPFVAAYFACVDDQDRDGAIWAFDRLLYEQEGKNQWRKHQQTTFDESGKDTAFRPELTAFLKNPPSWFVCLFYPPGFPRQNAQQSAFSFTSRFGAKHDDEIASLLKNPEKYHRLIVPSELKPKLLKTLYERYGIQRGALFPDTAGAVDTVFRACFQVHKKQKTSI